MYIFALNIFIWDGAGIIPVHFGMYETLNLMYSVVLNSNPLKLQFNYCYIIRN